MLPQQLKVQGQGGKASLHGAAAPRRNSGNFRVVFSRQATERAVVKGKISASPLKPCSFQGAQRQSFSFHQDAETRSFTSTPSKLLILDFQRLSPSWPF